jgi:MinD-like ATPase involved in chromosome partitioning or flagellar assembly
VNEVEVALAVSAREWPDRVHRFLADHGGARVRAQIPTSEEVLVESYQVLIIDDICSFLTPRLVDQVHLQGRSILGVFDPEDSADGKARLLECGVDMVIESDADGDEFVVALRTLALAEVRSDPAPPPAPAPASNLIVVTGPPGGCGATEVAIAFADRLSKRGSTVLVDVDEVSPAIAQRLGLPLLPNLRTALDAFQHRGGVEQSLLPVGDFSVIPGLSGERDWMEVRPSQVVDLLAELGRRFRYVLANCGSHHEQVGFTDAGRFGITRQVVGAADHLVAVGLPHPVGLTRLTVFMDRIALLNRSATRLIVINRRPRSSYRLGEISDEMGRTFPGIPITFLPHDPQVEAAAWAGALVASGGFARSVRKLVERSVVG